jgi:hypothetical protein
MARSSDATGSLTPAGRFIVEIFGVFGLLVIFLSAVYFAWRLPHSVAGGALFACLSWLSWRVRVLRPFAFSPPDRVGAWYGVVALVADTMVIAALLMARTGAALISPWDVVNPALFLLFALATGYAIFSVRRLGWGWGGLLMAIHISIAFGVSAIIYGIGFGYDPFVHEAATSYIFTHGVIFPKHPFYIGQYALVIAVQTLTRLGIHLIQTVLVPLLAPAAFVGASYVRSIRTQGTPAAALSAMLLMMYAPLTFTVPYDLALVLLIVVILLFEMMDRTTVRWTVWSLAGAAACIHPLIGLPALCLAFIGTLRLRGFRGFTSGVFLTAAVLTTALGVYAIRNGGSIALPAGEHLMGMMHAFVDPIFLPSGNHPFWTALYVMYYAWPIFLIVIGSAALLRRAGRSSLQTPFVGIAGGCLLAAIAVALSIHFKDIISYEQLEFSFRLISLTPWLLITGVMAAAEVVMRSRGAIWAVSIASMLAWYVAYPQFNPVFSVYSPGVGDADIHSVERIEKLANGTRYVALVPQMTSAAALQRIGFERSIDTVDGDIYPYAIPTGGVLYGKYFSIYYGGDSLDAITSAAAYAGVDTVFMTVPWGWDPWGNVEERLHASATRVEWVDDRWLFCFALRSTACQD